MTDSPTPSEPRIRTEAGRQLERDMGGDLFDAILAIEAEAATNGARQTLASIARTAEPAALRNRLAENLTRVSDAGRGEWHDRVLPNGAGDSWACVPIGEVIEVMHATLDEAETAEPAALDVERLRRAYCLAKHGGVHSRCDSYVIDATAAEYARLQSPDR